MGANQNNPSLPSQQLSEQPDQATFNAYFSDVFLAKLPGGVTFGSDAENRANAVKTSVFNFTAGDSFCTSFDVIKSIPEHSWANAIYDTNAKSYPIPVYPQQALATGNTIGCESLLIGQNESIPVGNYEYKAYVNNILVIVLPFEVR